MNTIVGGGGVPPEPNWTEFYSDELDLAFVRQKWGEVVRDLGESKALSIANGHAIKRLVDFQVQYERAARHVSENGAILPAKKAKIGQFNPYWAVMKHADEAIRVLETALGLTPTSRGKIKAVKVADKTQRASAQYLKPVS